MRIRRVFAEIRGRSIRGFINCSSPFIRFDTFRYSWRIWNRRVVTQRKDYLSPTCAFVIIEPIIVLFPSDSIRAYRSDRAFLPSRQNRMVGFTSPRHEKNLFKHVFQLVCATARISLLWTLESTNKTTSEFFVFFHG